MRVPLILADYFRRHVENQQTTSRQQAQLTYRQLCYSEPTRTLKQNGMEGENKPQKMVQ